MKVEETSSEKYSVKVICEIPMKLPSCNTYINECRRNKYAGAKLKAETEEEIMLYLKDLPRFEKPIKIAFRWCENNKRRDLDGICFGKKFILDAMVKSGVISDDNRKCVTAFTDTFEYGKEAKVVLTIEEVKEEQNNG
jgi:Holliday junction resolvase RusA-like endonuclease